MIEGSTCDKQYLGSRDVRIITAQHSKSESSCLSSSWLCLCDQVWFPSSLLTLFFIKQQEKEEESRKETIRW